MLGLQGPAQLRCGASAERQPAGGIHLFEMECDWGETKGRSRFLRGTGWRKSHAARPGVGLVETETGRKNGVAQRLEESSRRHQRRELLRKFVGLRYRPKTSGRGYL